MATPDEKLFDEVISNTLDMLRLSARKRAEVLRRLKAMEKSLVDKLATTTLKRAERRKVGDFLKASAKIIKDSYTQLLLELDAPGIAKTVAEITANSVAVVLGKEALALPTVDYFNSVAGSAMIQGSPAADWWSRQAQTTQMNFEAAIRQGLASAETNQQLISRIVGKSGQPGVMDIARHQAAALVQTSVQAVANDARLATFRKNSDVILGVKQVSTLDSHTSDICMAYSGAQWDLDGKPIRGNKLPFNGGPPRHFNCRSVLVPITKSFKDLGLDDVPERKSTTRASDEGQIKADISFDAFLKRKSKEYQDEALGEGRAELWRAGKITLKDLVDGNGRPMTLADLRRKAGLDAEETPKLAPSKNVVDAKPEAVIVNQQPEAKPMTKAEEIRQAIISHLKKTGNLPNYDTVGGYGAAKPVFDAMRADGTLVQVVQVSPKGRRTKVLRLKDGI